MCQAPERLGFLAAPAERGHTVEYFVSDFRLCVSENQPDPVSNNLDKTLNLLDFQSDTPDLKSRGPKGPCWFESSSGHQFLLGGHSGFPLESAPPYNFCTTSTEKHAAGPAMSIFLWSSG